MEESNNKVDGKIETEVKKEIKQETRPKFVNKNIAASKNFTGKKPGFGFSKGFKKSNDNTLANRSKKQKFHDEQNRIKKVVRTKSEFEERIVKINRISKTTKGGRNLRFSALVVIGNRKGKIGFGTGKALEVPNAVKKAVKNAEANVFTVKMNKHGTVYHEMLGRHGAAYVLLKPAPSGTGIIAGGPIRAVIELAGFTDIYTKNLGKNTQINMIRATIDGLRKQKTPKEIAYLRDLQINEL